MIIENKDKSFIFISLVICLITRRMMNYFVTSNINNIDGITIDIIIERCY